MTVTVPLTISERERELLRLLADGHSNLSIATHLYVSDRTVKTMVSTLCLRWALNNRAHLVAFALRNKVIS